MVRHDTKSWVVGSFLAASIILVPAPTVAADLANGKEVYAVRCLKCHAEDGKGSPRMVQMLQVEIPDFTSKRVQDKSDQELFQVINKGKGKMPGFQWSMGEKDREDVLAYVRTLNTR